MKPKTAFNERVLNKIINYLSLKEGFTLDEDSEYTDRGIKALLRDSFGFQYEVHIKTVNRLASLEKKEYL